MPFLGIAWIVAGLGLAFAWSADWIGHRGLTANQLLTSVEQDAPNPFPPGFRRAHGKGMCFTGQFVPTQQASDLSSARIFSDGATSVVGRLSLGAGDPHAADNSTRILSMSLLFKQLDGGEWRMAMINDSFFPTATVEGLVAMGEAFAPDPITYQPVPAKIEAFYEAYPEARKYIEASDKAPWSRSFSAPRSTASTLLHSPTNSIRDGLFDGHGSLGFHSADGPSSPEIKRAHRPCSMTWSPALPASLLFGI